MVDPCRVLEWAYGPQFQETGRNTLGHRIVSAEDRERAGQQLANLLYGEVLPSGVTTLLSSQNLAANRARKLVDIGSGCGKLALQAFVEFPNLESVVGVEICQSRTQVGINALRHLSKTQPLLFQLISADDSSCCVAIDDAAFAKYSEANDAEAANAVIEEFKNGGQVRGRPESAAAPGETAGCSNPSIAGHQQQQQQFPQPHIRHQNNRHPPHLDEDMQHQQLSQQGFAERASTAAGPPILCHHKLAAAASGKAAPLPPSAEQKPSRLAKLASAFGGTGGNDKNTASSSSAATSCAATSERGNRNHASGDGSRLNKFKQQQQHDQQSHRPPRTLELREGNMFLCKDIFDADVVICETKVPQAMMPKLHELVCRFVRGTRLLTYDDLTVEFEAAGLSLPVRRIPCRDRVLTSWAVSYGHLFHLWERI